jgi:hypothetical protein
MSQTTVNSFGNRRGTVMVIFVMCLIPLVMCVALAVDLGMLTVASTELKDVADAAALSGTRALNGNSTNNNNYTAALPAAQAVIANNSVLGTTVQNSQLTLEIGRYAYNTSAQQFQGNFPGTSGAWNTCRATVTVPISNMVGFSKIFNLSLPNYQAVAVAVHRPRDVCIILDYSGSMRFSSLLGVDYSGNRTTNNQDTVYPTSGHYSAAGSLIHAPEASVPYGDCNITTTTSDQRPPIVQDFYIDANGTPGFGTLSQTTTSGPDGDYPVTTSWNSTTTFAKTIKDITGSTSANSDFETNGYNANSMNNKKSQFYGYTQGPGYWGKTFFLWPPDPRSGKDWRTTYFNISSGKADNTKLWNSSSKNWQAPSSSTYSINYTAILKFITSTGPCPFPSTLRSGRIVYYTSIPTSIDTSNWPPTDLNQRFWKDYIDYVLGVVQTGSSSWSVICDYSNYGYMGYGQDFAWGTVQISSPPGGSQYMSYTDNPPRPLLKFWFGPLSMVDFLGNYNMWYNGYGNDCSRWCWWPGTCHESPMYACKLGIATALTDVGNNHPSDYLAMIMFSTPKTSYSDTSASRFNGPRVGLGQNYTALSDSLWYPPATVGNSSATVTPYDSNNLEVPRAMGGTCYAIALMQAYNQFSSNASLVNYDTANSGYAGGNGRIGAQKIVIFETDGAPNTTASATFVNGGANQSYYQVRYSKSNPSGSDYPTSVNGYTDNSSTVTSQIYTIVQNMAAQTSAGGFNTASHPLQFHCIAFGPQITTAALQTLGQMQTYGGVTDPGSPAYNMASYKIINGNANTVTANLQQAITQILQDGIQVSLIQ